MKPTLLQTPPAEVELVTISQYIAARSSALRVNPEMEGKRFYQIVLVLVLDNGFSLEAKQSFPLEEYSFDRQNLTAWAHLVFTNWIPCLSRADRKLFYGIKFIP